MLPLALVFGWLGFVTNPAVAAAAAASPTVTGPVTGGNGVPYFVQDLLVGFVDLADLGYEQSEFFISGTAKAYAPIDPLSPDGKWSVAPSESAPYTTRVVVYRPVKPRRFNGTVVLEWLNVSGQFEAKPDWVHTHTELLRDGFVYIAVSAQEAGVGTTKAGDPARYGPLSHPGDSFSYDIWSQAGQAVRSSSALLLGGLAPKRVLAMGESQSAGRLVTYINAVHLLVDVFDGYLVHSRGAGGPPIPTPAMERGKLRRWRPCRTHRAHPPPGVFECDVPINAGPMHWVMNAALYRLNRWVVRGTPPSVAPRLQTTAVSPVVFATNAVGNTLGGIRTPQVDAPIATLTGTGNGGQGQFGQFCGAFGTTVPFTESQLDALYKNHKQFAKRWRRAARRAVKAGFLLRPDARNLKRAARLSDIGK